MNESDITEIKSEMNKIHAERPGMSYDYFCTDDVILFIQCFLDWYIRKITKEEYAKIKEE